jgi:3-oxoadipate enol-lactonase
MERLGRDVLAVIGALGIAKINWCGLSMGGMVGQWLGANAPERVDKLVLSGRLKTVRDKGLAAIVDVNMERWFTKAFRDRNPQAMARMREMFLNTKPEGYIGCGEGIRDMDHRPLLAKISRRSSSPASTIRQRRSKPMNSSAITSRTRKSRSSMPPISPMSSSRKSMPTRC